MRGELGGQPARVPDAENPGNREIRREVVAAALERLGDPRMVGELADIGCGSGWWLERLTQSGVAPGLLGAMT